MRLPLSSEKFQFDLHYTKPTMYDWDSLRTEVVKFGARNSLLIALPPTASTASILGNNESPSRPSRPTCTTAGCCLANFPSLTSTS